MHGGVSMHDTGPQSSAIQIRLFEITLTVPLKVLISENMVLLGIKLRGKV